MMKSKGQSANSQQVEEPLFDPLWSEAERRAWILPETLKVADWADAFRILDAETSAEPGPYQTSRTPYMREVMNAFCDPEVTEISVMASAQVGKSRSIENMIGWAIDREPGPALYIVPTEEAVEYVAQKRIKNMVTESPILRRHWHGKRALKAHHHRYDTMDLFFGWAGSPSALASRTIRYLFRDEPDKYPAFTGRGGPPADLAEKRTQAFWDRKIVNVCTPTSKTGFIAAHYAQSDMRKYYVPCPRCGEYQVWVFAQLKVPKSLREPDEIKASADVWYECVYCAHKIREADKEECVAAGVWVPEGQTIDADGNIHGQPARSKRHSGYHISGLLSPFPGASWPNIMADWFAASSEEGKAQGKIIIFFNETLGEPFEETGLRIKPESLIQLKGGYNKRTVPVECKLLVAGADYHKSRARGIVRIDYEIRGFGPELRNWVVDSGSLASFEELERDVLQPALPWADGTDNEKRPWLAVTALLIDSGFEPDDVYEFCLRHPGLVFPTKGEPGPRLRPLQASDLEVATQRRLNRARRRHFRGLQLLIVDTSYFKNQVTSWVMPERDQDGKIVSEAKTQFYDELPEYYMREFSNEQKVKVRDRNGNVRYAWRPVRSGAPTHSLDTAVLAAAAAYYKGVWRLRDRNTPATTARPAARKRKIKLSELQAAKRGLL